jgi:hypothetical protein
VGVHDFCPTGTPIQFLRLPAWVVNSALRSELAKICLAGLFLNHCACLTYESHLLSHCEKSRGQAI